MVSWNLFCYKESMKSLRVPSLLIFSLLINSCATSPLGRKQLAFMPDSQMNQMGKQSFEELKQQTPIEHSASINAYVQCVAGHITAAAQNQLHVDKWDIVVFKSDQINAFALPGGEIGVYTGILPVLKTDAQLAAVLGHEVGHVIARHGNERVSEGMGAQGLMMIADILSGNSTPQNKQLIMGGIGLGVQYGIMLPFSRTHENEADLIGLKLMSQAGFDPRQAVEVWKNMSKMSGGKAPPEWMSTHPADASRIQSIESHLAEDLPLYEAAQRSGLRPHCVM